MSIVPIDIIKMAVNDLDVGEYINKAYMNTQKCYWILIEMQKLLLNLIYAQMFVFLQQWMYLCAIGHHFTQMNVYFLLVNSKSCIFI